MIRIRQIKTPVTIKENDLSKYIAKKLNIKETKIKNYKIHKKSIDARKKPEIFFVYEIDVEIDNEEMFLNKSSDILKTPDEKYNFIPKGENNYNNEIVIIGSGPAGLFCAYLLAEKGYKPLIIERGSKVDDRIKKVENFWKTGKLDENSNIQFGEGGAGTFSDGKLGTLIKDKENRMRKVFEIFIENGANPEILYDNKPHIGTDELQKIIVNMREKIISFGGKFIFNNSLEDIEISNNKIENIILKDKTKIKVDALVIAIGHSARDTFLMLKDKGLSMKSKAFAVGFRVMHSQEFINISQYGQKYSKILPEASYKLTYTTNDNKGVYTFCMCPGGYVVNASSEKKRLAINGMSYHKRDSSVANSAIITTIDSEDYGKNLFDGMEFQQKMEEKAFLLGQGKIPLESTQDYINNISPKEINEKILKIKGEYKLANLNAIYLENINNRIKEGLREFNKKIPGYTKNNSIIAGIETRTSSPIKIIRDESLESNIKGIYPCGEGAGYAGGITSAAMDGIKVFEQIANKFKAKL